MIDKRLTMSSIPKTMRAMVMKAPHQPLDLMEIPAPMPGPGQMLMRVKTCGVCRTDLHILDGELTEPKLPLILGHQIVGQVIALVPHSSSNDFSRLNLPQRFTIGQRVGVPWLGYTDATCSYCRRGQENLCPSARFTGYHIDGGFAEYAVADQRYCFPLPEPAPTVGQAVSLPEQEPPKPAYTDAELAPLLCAGLIGYRAYRLAGDNIVNLGIYGFGAAAHIITQVAIHQGKRVYAFTKPGDAQTQDFARRLGAVWAGDSGQQPPEALDAALIFAPVGGLIVDALRATAPGGVVVSGGIHMSDIPSFPYRLLWEERVIRSVANLTRQDAEEFLAIAPQVPVKTEVQPFPLEAANQALQALRRGQIQGAAVLVIGGIS
jgi:propanol-preferring alcohol dehydrogenase